MKIVTFPPCVARALPGCLAVLALTAVPASFVHAQVPARNRIVQSIENGSRTTLQGNIPPRARAQYDRGAVASTMPMQRVTLEFKLTSGQQADLNELLAEQQNPASTNYHHWLTPDEFGTRFGLSQADLNKVIDWLTAQGFRIDEVAHSRTWVAFSGTAGQVESAFQTQIHNYDVNGKTRYANATEPSIPSALAGVVLGVGGLNDFRPKPRAIRGAVRPRYTSGVSGYTYIVPNDFATIYDLGPLYNAGITGAGQTIAVMGQSDFVMSDIQTFRSLSGLPAPTAQNLKVILVPGSTDPGLVQGDVDEASLDVEWSEAVARDATILYVNSNNGVFDSLQYSIDNDVAPVISISYGDCEPDLGSSIGSYTILTMEANAQGETVVAPSGDNGATDCDTSLPATQGQAVDFPASSPYVTGVGGTEFYGDLSNTSQYWSPVNGSGYGSALSYIPEMVWNDTSLSGAPNATGGGPSSYFAKPAWQTGVGVPNDSARDVPDVSFSASPYNDPYLICSRDYGGATVQPWCTTATDGFRDSNAGSSNYGYLDAFGGTSLGVPTFAGVVALINQETSLAQGNTNTHGVSMGGQGNVNYVLYPLAVNAPNAFHDIVTVTGGDNDNSIPCQQGTPNCTAPTTSIGYTVGVGYDMTTGLGSLDVYNLVTAWPSISPTEGGCDAGLGCPGADFQLSAYPAAMSLVRGNTGTATVTVAAINGFSGTVNLSCSVSSNLTGTTCSVSPSSATPGGNVTLTVTTQAQTAVAHPGGFGDSGWSWPFPAAIVLAILAALLFAATRLGAWAGQASAPGRVPHRIASCLALACLLTAAVGCGGGGGGSSSNPPPPSTVSSAVTVQGTSGSTNHTAQVMVTLQ